MSIENTMFFGSAALNWVNTWYCHVFRIALKGMYFWWIKLSCLSNPPSVTSTWRWGLNPIFLENGCSTTIAPAVNLPPLCLYEIVSLIATIAASIKTFRRKRLFFIYEKVYRQPHPEGSFYSIFCEKIVFHDWPQSIRDCEYCVSMRYVE